MQYTLCGSIWIIIFKKLCATKENTFGISWHQFCHSIDCYVITLCITNYFVLHSIEIDPNCFVNTWICFFYRPAEIIGTSVEIQILYDSLSHILRSWFYFGFLQKRLVSVVKVINCSGCMWTPMMLSTWKNLRYFCFRI